MGVPGSPERIIGFSHAAMETVSQLGLEDRAVGVGACCARGRSAALGCHNTYRCEVLDELDPNLSFTVTLYQREFALTLQEGRSLTRTLSL